MKKTWLLGLGFFSISITWSIYNAFVPYLLEAYITKSLALIGFMMTIDNYLAIILQPLIGRKSDRINTRFGKRMPFLMIGMPLAAIFGALIPWHNSFFVLIAFMVLMNLSMSLYRSPTIALMPDITAPAKRTQANGIINFMGGLGAILAFGGGAYLHDQHVSLPFLVAGILSLLCFFILFQTIKERRDVIHYTTAVDEEKRSLISSYKGEWTKPTIILLCAIFFWFFAYQGIEALFTLYGTKQLGLTKSESAFSLAFFSVAFVAAAIPSGLLGKRFGKKKVITIGVCGLIIIFGSITLVKSMLLLRILLLIGGVFWACININSYPFVVALGKESSIGTRTGIYYIASSLAAILSPVFMGLMVDLFNYTALFITASASMLIALFFLLNVDSSADTKPTEA